MPSRRPRIGQAVTAPPSLFVDSSAWIALRSRRDQHHADADRLFRDALARRIPLVTTGLVVAETHRLTLFRVGVQPARRFLELVDASSGVTIHFPGVADHAAARRWLERLGSRPVTYTDAVSFAVMERLDIQEAIAFDEHFRQYGQFTIL